MDLGTHQSGERSPGARDPDAHGAALGGAHRVRHSPPRSGGFTALLGEILNLAVDESERQLSSLRSASLADLGIALLLSAPELERDVACRELDVSASYLARQFQRQVGASFVGFRTRARVVSFLAAARRGTTLLGAALDSGFGSYSQAHRVFSALTGYSPCHYLYDGGRDEVSLII